jgi:putative component of membrane protein insertase Oxa1/YidC/SpoIIIJ protein YidD
MLLKPLALVLIRGYQKFISPYKGFSCALRVRTGGHSCSRYGYDAIARHGFLLGMKLLYRRLAKCSWHAHQHACQHTHQAVAYKPRPAFPPGTVMRNGRLVHQGGFADCDCSGCDAPSCDVPSCDMPSCELPSCDMPSCGSPRALSCAGDAAEGACWGCDVPSSCGTTNRCASPCDCGPNFGKPGHVREQSRLDELNKRREEKKGNEEEEDDTESGDD